MTELEKIKRKLMISLYNQLSVDQKALFNRIYNDVKDVEIDALDTAIRLCETTVKKNNEGGM
ncbi:hypothetical protein LCGC14_2827620 [marine sediment metagenome]|uniref:Uncharacterized protein n=1 Tax=marine sediment metagenome TaxID=412755 RepID=A0A0F9B673_9ZZZZ